MKTFKALSTTLVLSLLVCSSVSFASSKKTAPKKIDIAQDIDTLGGNKELMEMAEKIRSTSRSRIVQDRIVERRNKLELGMTYGSVFGGDAYVSTQSIGAAIDYHFTPRWSLGLRYYDFGNSLTNEGKRIYNEARESMNAGGRALPMDIDYPLNATMAVINWYPIYGKTSFLDMGVTQFDIYLLAGGGNITLSSGDTSVVTGGLGIGAWLTKHISARAEIRYQTYNDQIATGSRSLDIVTGSLGIGWIL